METPTVEALAKRLETLERENHLLKRVGATLVLGSAVLAIVGTNLFRAPKQIEAERFVVKDSQGHTRAVLSVRPDGQPALALLDERGGDQVLLRSTPDHSSSLEFYNGPRLHLAMSSASTGASSLSLLDGDSGIATGLYHWPGGDSGLALNHGLGGASIGVKPDGSARLSFSDVEGQIRGGLGVSSEGQMITLSESTSTRSLTQTAPAPVNSEPDVTASRTSSARHSSKDKKPVPISGLGGGSSSFIRTATAP